MPTNPDPGAAAHDAADQVLAVLAALSAQAQDDPGVAPGLLMHDLVEQTGLPRYTVKRALGDLAGEGRVVKTGSRYHLPGEAERLAERAAVRKAQRKARRQAGPQAPPAPTPGVVFAPAPSPARHNDAAIGQIRVHPAGYGFVQREDGQDDVFVSARNRGTALDGDRVQLLTWMGYKGTEGRVVEVLARGRARLTGVVRSEGRACYLVPDDPRLAAAHDRLLLPEGPGGSQGGQSVVAEITHYPRSEGEPLRARVLRVLGTPDEPRTEVAKILVCADLPVEFPAEVAEAGERAPQEVGGADLVDRLDLRDRPFVTIDPENARDFDDAVCVEPSVRPGCDRLWVAVADVSHYVRQGHGLDLEARVRGCSVYLPDRVIPMLPLPLSAGICSLNPDVERLAMVVGLDINGAGEVVHRQFAAAVIRSHGRLDYGGVALALSGELRGSHARYREHLPQLRRLREVAGRLRKQRMARGALDFELPEARVILDAGNPAAGEGEGPVVRDVVRSRQSPEVREAYRLVEDCMLAANEAVALFFRERALPALFRVHDTPGEEQLLAFAALAESHGLTFDAEAARTPLYLRDFLRRLKGRPMEQALSYLLLRALKKAHYDVESRGHFGLAATDYLHFTSPIRRYPDLVVHRLLKQQLRREGQPGGGQAQPPQPALPELQQWSLDSSTAERRAMEVEREVVDLYRAVLMRDQVGQEFDGTIVGVTGFGIFVALDAPYVEGLIKTDRLGSGYEFDQRSVRLVGRRSGLAFGLGDRVRVAVENVSVARRKVDLLLVRKLEGADTGAAAGPDEEFDLDRDMAPLPQPPRRKPARARARPPERTPARRDQGPAKKGGKPAKAQGKAPGRKR